jgi:SAM-dependent methyltransferase
MTVQEKKTTKQVLDPCSGSRMMWFDKGDDRALFGDKRNETHTLCDGRALEISPDKIMDFTALPFADNTFRLVAFDPPHLINAGETSWLRAKYGVLSENWKDDLRLGFAECFRVLKPEGVLVFKWAETQIKVREILALTPHKPLFGHTTGRHGATHWMTFMKPDQGNQK